MGYRQDTRCVRLPKHCSARHRRSAVRLPAKGDRQSYRHCRRTKQHGSDLDAPKSAALLSRVSSGVPVANKLALEWSPEQISGWLKSTYPEDETLRVSHETIYKSIFVQTRGVLKKELQKHLRTQRAFRQSRHSSLRGTGRGQIVDGVSIAERPPEIEDRAVPGHWEGDLIAGFADSYIATLVERHSRFTMLVKVNGKDTRTVVTALSKQVRKLPAQLRQSLTWDRGMELADHKTFTLATDTQVYFCDPRSPWQRGTNENTNRLLRQYFPKGKDLSVFSQAELNKVARKLNQRPRKTLGYETPADKLQASVASPVEPVNANIVGNSGGNESCPLTFVQSVNKSQFACANFTDAMPWSR